jgi:hypothetical protein
MIYDRRTVDVLTELVPILADHLTRFVGPDADALVFTSPEVTPPRRTITRLFCSRRSKGPPTCGDPPKHGASCRLQPAPNRGVGVERMGKCNLSRWKRCISSDTGRPIGTAPVAVRVSWTHP